MPFPECVRFQKALQAYTIMNNICPKYWHNYITFTNEIHSKNLRSDEKLNIYIPKHNIELFRKSFAYSRRAGRRSGRGEAVIVWLLLYITIYLIVTRIKIILQVILPLCRLSILSLFPKCQFFNIQIYNENDNETCSYIVRQLPVKRPFHQGWFWSR